MMQTLYQEHKDGKLKEPVYDLYATALPEDEVSTCKEQALV
jgi:hypothetical protein